MSTRTRTPQPNAFYVIGGTVPRDAPSYVERQADTTLLEGLRQAQFCYVLTSRQMGKSSLMARTAARLREEGVAVAVLDLTAIGQNLTPEQWYDGLLNLLARALDLEDQMEDFWFAHERLSPLQRWMQALQEVVLKLVPGPVVIFIDEIDAVRSLPFSADEFFAAIRECYNRRVEEPEYRRLSFCLLGVATPSDLIRDTRTTPFNIGRRVELGDFTVEEAKPLSAGLQEATPSQDIPDALLARLLSRVLYWTGGHPYLTQRLCQSVAEGLERGEAGSPELVDRQCGELFLSASAQEQDDNLILVRERLLRSEADLASLLTLYGQVLKGKRVPDDETKPLVNVLKLSGVVAAKNGVLAVRNRIYGRIFDGGWVVEHMPDAELRRQRVAYRRGLLRATSVVATVLLLIGGIVGLWVTSRHALQDKQEAMRMANQRETYNKTLQDKQKSLETAQRKLQQALKETQQSSEHAQTEAKSAGLAAQSERNQRHLAEEARQNAEHARKIAQDKAAEVVRLNRVVEEQSYLMQARALRTGGQPGWRINSLSVLANAAKLHPLPGMTTLLRNEAIADMALPVDIRVRSREPGDRTRRPDAQTIDVDLDHDRYFVANLHGDITIRRISDKRLVKKLHGYGQPCSFMNRMSPDGRYIYLLYDDGTVRLWDCVTGLAVLAIPQSHFTNERSLDFSSDSRWAAVTYPASSGKESIRIISLPTGRMMKTFTLPGFAHNGLRLSPDNSALAIAGEEGGPGVHLLNLRDGSLSYIPIAAGANEAAWQPDGSRLAVVGNDGNIYLLDPDARRIILHTEGTSGDILQLTFNPTGTLLASSGRDNRIQLWAPDSGKQLLVCDVAASRRLRFSRDGRRLTGVDSQGSCVIDVVESEAHVVLKGRRSTGWWCGSPEFSPDGRLLLLGNDNGFDIWEVMTARKIRHVEIGGCRAAAFSPDGRQLITSGPSQLNSWDVSIEPTSAIIKMGKSRNLAAWKPINGEYFCQSGDGRILAVVHRADEPHPLAHVFIAGRSGSMVLRSGDRMRFIAISSDSRWIATSPWGGNHPQLCVWDANTGNRVRSMPTATFTELAFSPDHRWLVGGGSDYQFWEVGTWRRGPTIRRDQGSRGPAPVDFTRDGRLMAIAASSTLIHLVDARTLSTIATLEAPGQTSVLLWLRFSPDGTRLAVLWSDGVLGLWNLHLLRQRLSVMKLDWDLPPYPPPGKEPDTGSLYIEMIGARQSDRERPGNLFARRGKYHGNTAKPSDGGDRARSVHGHRRLFAMFYGGAGAPVPGTAPTGAADAGVSARPGAQ